MGENARENDPTFQLPASPRSMTCQRDTEASAQCEGTSLKSTSSKVQAENVRVFARLAGSVQVNRRKTVRVRCALGKGKFW
jgi:hypothetical protein